MRFFNWNYKKYLGYTLLIFAFITYKLRFSISIAFLSTEVIIVIDVVLGLIGVILAIGGERKDLNKDEHNHEILLGRLRLHAEKIILTVANCEVRENNYYEEFVNKSIGTAAVADALYAPNRNVVRNFVMQTAIIYYYQTEHKQMRMTSQTFPYTKEILESFLVKGSVILYVDRFNKNEYAFDIKQ